MAQVMVQTADLRRYADAISNLSQFILLSDVSLEQRIKASAMASIIADLIKERISNVTDDFGSGVDVLDRLPVLAGNDGGLS